MPKNSDTGARGGQSGPCHHLAEPVGTGIRPHGDRCRLHFPQLSGRRLAQAENWRRIQLARDLDIISAEDYRDEMVNLQRWRLEQDLGYAMTARIPMRMPSGMPIYDMVFATDHPVGNKIMTDLYRKAAEREPLMRQEAKAKAKDKRSRNAGRDTLFDLPASSIPVDTLSWEPTDSWDPATRPWWHQEPDPPA